jgi:two-component system sensor histidine kinase RstB
LPVWRRYREYARIIERVELAAATWEDFWVLRRDSCDLIALAAAAADLHVGRARSSIPTTPCGYHADADLMLRVFENLAANSAKFMADDDRLFVRVSATPRGGVVIDWENTGSTIEPAIAEQVFELGYTRTPDGFGVGLAVARLFVELHGGRLHAVPSPDTAVLRIELPGPAAAAATADSMTDSP